MGSERVDTTERLTSLSSWLSKLVAFGIGQKLQTGALKGTLHWELLLRAEAL